MGARVLVGFRQEGSAPSTPYMKAREPLQSRARAAATGSDRHWVLGLSAAWFHGCRRTEKNLGRAAARQGPSRV